LTATQDLSPVFAALANRHRREIVYALGLQPRSISRLASLRGLSLPAIHKHIRVLEDAELVIRKKVGRTNYLALNRAPLRDLQAWVDEFHPYWGDARETLDNYARYLGTDTPDEEGQP
jgi:DNA-binding transcriptional ArsR family regulator